MMVMLGDAGLVTDAEECIVTSVLL